MGGEYDRRILEGVVGRFGKYLMERSYDVGMADAELTLARHWNDRSKQELADRLRTLTDDERDAAMRLVRDALVAALHGLLHGLSHDEDRIQLTFDGEDVAEQSDGLHGDLFLFLRFLSRYPYDIDKDLDL